MNESRSDVAEEKSVIPSEPSCIYVAGTGRNGSTLLGMLLGQQPNVFFAGELTHIWRRGFLENHLCGCGRPFLTCEFWRAVATDFFSCESELSLREITELRDRISSLWNLPCLLGGRRCLAEQSSRYAQIHRQLLHSICRVSDCRVIVDSSKYPTDLAALLQGNQPLRVIHLVRDCRAVVYSWRTSKKRPEIHWKEENMPRYGPMQTAVAWRVFNIAIERLLAEEGAEGKILRYEDLVADSGTRCEQLFDWIGLDGAFERLASACTEHSVSGNPCRFQTGDLKITTDERWRGSLSRMDRRIVSTVCGSLQRKYGYGN